MLKRSPSDDDAEQHRKRDAAYRHRKRHGLKQIKVNVSDVGLPCLLVELGFLPHGSEDDKEALEAATTKLLKALVVRDVARR